MEIRTLFHLELKLGVLAGRLIRTATVRSHKDLAYVLASSTVLAYL